MKAIWKTNPLLRGTVLAAAVIVVYLTHSSIASSQVCVNCTQRASGKEVRILGIPIWKSRIIINRPWHLMDPGIPMQRHRPVDARIYKELFGEECKHAFLVIGKCVSTYGLTRCMASGTHYRYRLEAIKQLFHLYRRMPNKELGRRTYELIEKAWEKDEKPKTDLFYLSEIMHVTVTEEEWRNLLVAD